MEFLNIINIATVIASLASLAGMLISIFKIRETSMAEKNLIKILYKDHHFRVKVNEKYKDMFNNDKKLGEFEEEIKHELSKLKSESQRDRLLDILNNNIEKGKRRYINHLLTSLTSLVNRGSAI